MTGDLPPARQCDLPRCDREAVDPGPGANACPEHHPDRGDGSGEDGRDEGGEANDTPDRGAPTDGGENRQEGSDSPRPNPRGSADVSGSAPGGCRPSGSNLEAAT